MISQFLSEGVEFILKFKRKAFQTMSATPTPKGRKFIDCGEFPNEKNCTLKISGTEDEVLDLAVLHATRSHGHEDTPEFREQLRGALKDE